ncbi:hypothetical protein UJ101_01674 [Flavobacteriaceae bacterium UJ101]|nr:hypothetical protein UJ101_01674 [Flavobacteriaceae bacterium UJ101]
MKKYGILFVIFLSVVSCIKRFEEPENLLSKEQMRDLLIEIGLSKNIPHNVLDTLVRDSKNKADKRILKILDKNTITLEVFRKSHQYYTMYPEEYKLIFKMIKDSLNKELTQLKIEDSLARKDKDVKKDEKKTPPKKLSQEELKKIDKQKKDSIMKPIKKKMDSLRKQK